MSDYAKTALNNSDIKLWAKNNEDTWASMSFAVVTSGRQKNDNVLEITVWTNEKSDNDKYIRISLDVVTLGMFIQNLKDIAAAPAGERYDAPIIGMEATRWKKENGKNVPDGTYIESRLVMGKGEDGVCWMSLLSSKQSRPAIKFIIHQNKFRKLLDRKGEPIPVGRQSELASLAFARLFEQMTYLLLVNRYVEPQPTNQGGGNNYGNRGNGGNGGNYNNGGGNYNNGGNRGGYGNNYGGGGGATADGVPDDDIPF